jgi:iron-sulfur cluster assembly protein
MVSDTNNQLVSAAHPPLADERLIRITARARQRILFLLNQQHRPRGVLRVAIAGGGCSGLQYKMELQDAPAERDLIVELAGVRVAVDPESALYVTGSELDYTGTIDGGFKVNNPGMATSCACSFNG